MSRSRQRIPVLRDQPEIVAVGALYADGTSVIVAVDPACDDSIAMVSPKRRQLIQVLRDAEVIS